MPTDIANSSNLQTVPSSSQTAARAASFNSQKQSVDQLPDEGPQRAESVRQILPTGKEDTAEPTSEEVRVVVEKLNRQIQALQRELSFSVDEDSGRTVVRVLDSQTNEVVRQIPSEEVLKFARQLDIILSEANDQQVSGILVEEQA